MLSQNTAEIRQFFDGQEIYLTVIRENYMMHREIIRWIGDRCRRFGNSGIHILEVGCGDAYVVSELAQRLEIESYLGIDLAENSLQRARLLLESHIPQLELIQGDFAEKVRHLSGRFDLILAGYVLHHLTTPGKKKVFGTFHKLLKENGAFIIYDVTKTKEESREVYNNRTLDYYHTRWTALTREQFQGIRQHVTTYDFPESFDTWTALAVENDFIPGASTYLDPTRFFSIMEFARNQA